MIYLDLDNMLIDTLYWAGRIKDFLAAHGVSEEIYVRANLLVMQEFGRYTPERHKLVLERFTAVPETFIQTVRSYTEEGGLLFPDTQEFLAAFPKKELAILTSGDPDLQILKIQANDLYERVGNIFIAMGPHKYELIPPPPLDQPTFFLDDAPKEIENMKKHYAQMICIQVREAPFWEAQKETTFADIHVPTLKEAQIYIQDRLRTS